MRASGNIDAAYAMPQLYTVYPLLETPMRISSRGRR